MDFPLAAAYLGCTLRFGYQSSCVMFDIKKSKYSTKIGKDSLIAQTTVKALKTYVAFKAKKIDLKECMSDFQQA